MRAAKLLLHRSFIFIASLITACSAMLVTGNAQIVTAVCSPKIIANDVVVTSAQREAAGEIAQPPITDHQNGFAWPDTPLGVTKIDGHYLFFGSDGGLHSRQMLHGQWVGNNKYGSATTTAGTLDNPLGSAPPLDVSIDPNPDPAVNPYYQSYDYMGGGPVYKVGRGTVAGGYLLMLYHAEIPTGPTQSFYAVLGLARSLDQGLTWTDLGEIVRINQGYRTDMDGFDIGDPSLVLSPDHKYFYVYFPDWHANGTTHWGNTVTSVSAARALVSDVLKAAFSNKPHAVAFQKFYQGWNFDQGLGGYSTDLNPQGFYGGTLQVAYNAAIKRYQMLVNGGVVIYYAESPDGLSWSQLSLLYDFRTEADQPSVYSAAVGMGEDPTILGKKFYIFYTRIPMNQGWPGASVDRFTVSCP